MRNAMKLVRDLYRKFECGHLSGKVPDTLPVEEAAFRASAIREEVDEFVEAQTIEGQADALIDCIVFALGGLERMGLASHAERLFEEVMRANMQKERAPAKGGKRGIHDKLAKPEGWRPPDLTPIISQPPRWTDPHPAFAHAQRLMDRKSEDYGCEDHAKSEYFPMGDESYFTMVWVKVVRMQSLVARGSANYEALEDSIIDCVNYLAFWWASKTRVPEPCAGETGWVKGTAEETLFQSPEGEDMPVQSQENDKYLAWNGDSFIFRRGVWIENTDPEPYIPVNGDTRCDNATGNAYIYRDGKWHEDDEYDHSMVGAA